MTLLTRTRGRSNTKELEMKREKTQSTVLEVPRLTPSWPLSMRPRAVREQLLSPLPGTMRQSLEKWNLCIITGGKHMPLHKVGRNRAQDLPGVDGFLQFLLQSRSAEIQALRAPRGG